MWHVHVQIQAMLRAMFPGKVCGDVIDPDEAVAAGAAVSAAGARLPEHLVISVADVLPTDLGIQVHDNTLVRASHCHIHGGRPFCGCVPSLVEAAASRK